MKLYPADTEFSHFIRSRDGWRCRRCFKNYPPPTSALHNSHFFSRGKWGTRFDPDNCISLCYGCHSYFDHAGKAEYTLFKINELGQKGFDYLTLRAWSKSPLGSNYWKKLTKKQAKEIFKELTDATN